MRCITVSGSFAELNLPVLEGCHEWDTSQLLVDGTLYAGAIPLEGDFNCDGTVDAGDYTAWRDSLGQYVTPGTGADADENGYIGLEDYALWKNHFGESNASGSSETVPEPTTAILVLMICVGYCRSRL